MHVDHLCRNTRCVNPDHLEAVTPKVNAERRPYPIKSECPRGHPYQGDNVFLNNRGERCCRECSRISASATYARHAEEYAAKARQRRADKKGR
jgi:hypothetical protein